MSIRGSSLLPVRSSSRSSARHSLLVRLLSMTWLLPIRSWPTREVQLTWMKLSVSSSLRAKTPPSSGSRLSSTSALWLGHAGIFRRLVRSSRAMITPATSLPRLPISLLCSPSLRRMLRRLSVVPVTSSVAIPRWLRVLPSSQSSGSPTMLMAIMIKLSAPSSPYRSSRTISPRQRRAMPSVLHSMLRDATKKRFVR